jgi:hypothetical protein
MPKLVGPFTGTDTMSGDASDRTGGGPRPGSRRSTAMRRCIEAVPVEGVPEWYVVRRTAPAASAGDPMRSWHRFRLTAVSVTVGLVALVLVLSMVRAHWSQAPAEHTAVVSMPPLAISPETGAAADPPLAPNAPTEQTGRSRDKSATMVLQAKAAPARPDEPAALPLESLEVFEGLTAVRESGTRPVAGTPSVARSQSAIGSSLSRAQESGREPVEAGRSPPQVEVKPATSSPAASLRTASEVANSDDQSALPAGDIRIFIHYIADHRRDATLAQRLADYLRGRGFIVADIRPVDFGIGKPAVRYFFARDSAASQRLVRELGRFSAGGASLGPDHATDFTHFLPKPRQGNVEVWLPAS